MFAISVRVSPCSARSSPRSVGRVTTSSPSACSTFIRWGTTCESSPSGPLTWTRPGEIATLTVLGSSMGRLPIRLIGLPDEGDDLAADAALRGLAAGDQPGRSGQDRRPEPAEHARQAVLARVDAAAGARDPLDAGDHALAVAAELELDDEGRVRLALDLDDSEVLDVALVLEDAGDLLLDPGGRHLGCVLHRLVGVADAGQHVCDRVCQHVGSYQLDFVMPGMAPWWASSRRQILQRPNFLKTARGRPQRLQRVYCRTLYFCVRFCLTTSDVLAMS